MGSLLSKTKSKSNSFGETGSFLEYSEIASVVKRGDLIEIYRSFAIKHWVICKSVDSNGTVWCYHVTDPITGSKNLSFNTKARIKFEPLEDILKDTDDDQPSLCRVNNQEYLAQKVLEMPNKQWPGLDEVFKFLDNMKNTYVKYNLKCNNCEHYSTLWKYGIGWSSQVSTVKQILFGISWVFNNGLNWVCAQGALVLWRFGSLALLLLAPGIIMFSICVALSIGSVCLMFYFKQDNYLLQTESVQ